MYQMASKIFKTGFLSPRNLWANIFLITETNKFVYYKETA